MASASSSSASLTECTVSFAKVAGSQPVSVRDTPDTKQDPNQGNVLFEAYGYQITGMHTLFAAACAILILVILWLWSNATAVMATSTSDMPDYMEKLPELVKEILYDLWTFSFIRLYWYLAWTLTKFVLVTGLVEACFYWFFCLCLIRLADFRSLLAKEDTKSWFGFVAKVHHTLESVSKVSVFNLWVRVEVILWSYRLVQLGLALWRLYTKLLNFI